MCHCRESLPGKASTCIPARSPLPPSAIRAPILGWAHTGGLSSGLPQLDRPEFYESGLGFPGALFVPDGLFRLVSASNHVAPPAVFRPATTKPLMPGCFAKSKILCAYASQATPAISPQGPVQVVLQLARAGTGLASTMGSRTAEWPTSQPNLCRENGFILVSLSFCMCKMGTVPSWKCAAWNRPLSKHRQRYGVAVGLHLSDLWPLRSQDRASRCCSG